MDTKTPITPSSCTQIEWINVTPADIKSALETYKAQLFPGQDEYLPTKGLMDELEAFYLNLKNQTELTPQNFFVLMQILFNLDALMARDPEVRFQIAGVIDPLKEKAGYDSEFAKRISQSNINSPIYASVVEYLTKLKLLDRDAALAVYEKASLHNAYIPILELLNEFSWLNKRILLTIFKNRYVNINFNPLVRSLKGFDWIDEEILLAFFKNTNTNMNFVPMLEFFNDLGWLNKNILLDVFKNENINDTFFQKLRSLNEEGLLDQNTATALCRGWGQHTTYILNWLEEIGLFNKETLLTVCNNANRALYVRRTLGPLKEFNFDENLLKKIALIILNDADYDVSSYGCFFDMVSIFELLSPMGLLNDENIEALCKTAKYSVGMSGAFVILKHYEKLDQNNFDIICDNPAKAVFVATQLGGTIPYVCNIHPGIVEYCTTAAAKIMARPSSTCLFSLVPRDVGRQISSYLGNDNFGQKHRNRIEAYFDGPSPAEKISNAIQPVLLQEENHKVESVDLSNGGIKIIFNSPDAAVFFSKKCHEIDNIFNLTYDPSQPNQINIESPEMVERFSTTICKLDFNAFCEECPDFKANHSNTASQNR